MAINMHDIQNVTCVVIAMYNIQQIRISKVDEYVERINISIIVEDIQWIKISIVDEDI